MAQTSYSSNDAINDHKKSSAQSKNVEPVQPEHGFDSNQASAQISQLQPNMQVELESHLKNIMPNLIEALIKQHQQQLIAELHDKLTEAANQFIEEKAPA